MQVRLNQVSYLVLDEADRMLDMGFEPQVRAARCPNCCRQTWRHASCCCVIGPASIWVSSFGTTA